MNFKSGKVVFITLCFGSVVTFPKPTDGLLLLFCSYTGHKSEEPSVENLCYYLFLCFWSHII